MKTYVLDASALLTYLGDHQQAFKVKELFGAALVHKAEVLMSAVNWGEAYFTITRKGGEPQAALARATVQNLPLTIVPVDTETAMKAAQLKAAHHLHYTDCFAAELAISRAATLLTCDNDFRSLGKRVKIVWLKSH